MVRHGWLPPEAVRLAVRLAVWCGWSGWTTRHRDRCRRAWRSTGQVEATRAVCLHACRLRYVLGGFYLDAALDRKGKSGERRLGCTRWVLGRLLDVCPEAGGWIDRLDRLGAPRAACPSVGVLFQTRSDGQSPHSTEARPAVHSGEKRDARRGSWALFSNPPLHAVRRALGLSRLDACSALTPLPYSVGRVARSSALQPPSTSQHSMPLHAPASR